MPTFTALALDSLLEPGASRPMTPIRKVPDSKVERRNRTSDSKLDRRIPDSNSKLERGISLPPSKPERINGTSTTTTIDKRHLWAQPALYATPKSTPLPDSPSSFPPSPYIINHKRRGPRLLKSFSEDDVAARQRALEQEKLAENGINAEGEVSGSATDETCTFGEVADSVKDDHVVVTAHSAVEPVNDVCDGGCASKGLSNGLAGENRSLKFVTFNMERDGQEDDFFDPQEALSTASNNTEGETNGGVERSLNLATPVSEFYDAWEELSSESGPQPPLHDIEAELREMRLSLLMEIEKRKQAEETLSTMQNQWLKIWEQLSLVGLTLPADSVAVMGDEQSDDPAEELSRQVHLARFVSNCIGRGTAKAEVETEMEAQIESKNFEIARLWDRLHYYEAVNREMSQRNQEAVESGRCLRQRRKRRQRWVWGSIATTITLGTAALAWSYLPSGKTSSFSNQSHTPEGDNASKSGASG
ncbi:unnamed protein product [Ilex paraguariensis]|uniref:Uncharacterized protein n=1 Tax=Ilex paraguariensis TaxID=185542 RepID=A0ABC8SB16_9AQUA